MVSYRSPSWAARHSIGIKHDDGTPHWSYSTVNSTVRWRLSLLLKYVLRTTVPPDGLGLCVGALKIDHAQSAPQGISCIAVSGPGALSAVVQQCGLRLVAPWGT